MLSCKGALSGVGYCINEKTRELIQGQQGTALWYEQRIYLWIHKKRLVELWVNDENILSREKTQREFETAVKSDLWILLTAILLMIGGTLLHIKYIGRKE